MNTSPMYHNTRYCHTLHPQLLKQNLCQKIVKQTKNFGIDMIFFFLKRLVLRILAFLAFMTVSSNLLTQGICLDLYGSSFLHNGLEISSRQQLRQSQVHLICFLSLRDHCPSLPDTKCLENYCFMFFLLCFFLLLLFLLFWLFQEEK